MPVSVTYPGVYIDELPSQVRTIVGVPTSITAFVGAALRGEVDEPVHITSWSDYDRRFGGLWSGSPMSYAVFHYYQNGGVEAEIVRVAAGDAAAATIALGDVTLDAASKGKWGNELRARVDYETKDPANDKLYNLTVRNTATGEEESFRNIEATKGSPRALSKVLAGSLLVGVKDDSLDDTRPAASEKAKPGVDPFADPPKLALTLTKSADPAAFAVVGDTITYTYEISNTGPVPIEGPFTIKDDKEQAEITVTANTPLAPGAKLPPTTRDYDVTQADLDAKLITNTATANAGDLKSAPAVVTVTGPDGQAPAASTSYAAATGGNNGSAVSSDVLKGDDGDKTGMYALRRLQNRIFNLLCIPFEAKLDFLDDAAKFCFDHRAMLLVDPPDWKTLEDAVAGAAAPIVGGDGARNAAVFFPRLKFRDNEGNVAEYPPCGAVAGVIARTDGQRGVWKAPAGTEASIAGVRGLSVPMTNLEHGQLNPLGVNCIRNFPVIGNVVWGSRTLRGADQLADQWKYLPVRRTALFVEESLYRGTQWVVFEPNDEPLWASIRLNVGAFMNSLWRQGAFQGTTAQDAYVVQCDAENNPQNDIDRGIVNILVGFAPLKPAEFVLIHIQQLAGQIQT